MENESERLLARITIIADGLTKLTLKNVGNDLILTDANNTLKLCGVGILAVKEVDGGYSVTTYDYSVQMYLHLNIDSDLNVVSHATTSNSQFPDPDRFIGADRRVSVAQKPVTSEVQSMPSKEELKLDGIVRSLDEDMFRRCEEHEKLLEKQVSVVNGYIDITIENEIHEYSIELTRCDTAEKILDWVHHLVHKGWMNADVLCRFIHLACKENKITIPNA